MHKLYSTQPERVEPIEGTVKGEIPKWVSGSLYRNGPGLYEFGEDKYVHMFDPLAVFQRFHIKEGKATYSSRYLRSDQFNKNSKYNRIVCRAFGTPASIPDPCKNIYQRFLSYFQMDENDNTIVSFFPMNDDIYAATETTLLHKVDPETLETQGKVDMKNYVDVHTATAHPHWDKDGTVHNIGNSYKGGPHVCLIKFPGDKANGTLPQGEIVSRIRCSAKMSSNYMHSFGMTENYYVYVEQPLFINLLKLMTAKIRGVPFHSAMEWCPDVNTKFHIIDRKTGEEINLKFSYEAKAFLTFHHANAYEEDGHIVVDCCCFDSNKPLEFVYCKDLTSPQVLENWKKIDEPRLRRFVLPLNVKEDTPTGRNLVTLPGEKATAERTVKGDKIMCTYEEIVPVGLEFPQINYDRFNTKKNRYIYGIGWHNTGDYFHTIEKIDLKNRTNIQWAEKDSYPSEALFVPNPNGMDEDDGVLLSAVNHSEQGSSSNDRSYLLVLDAKTMNELARVSFDMKRFPKDFHGLYRATPES